MAHGGTGYLAEGACVFRANSSCAQLVGLRGTCDTGTRACCWARGSLISAALRAAVLCDAPL